MWFWVQWVGVLTRGGGRCARCGSMLTFLESLTAGSAIIAQAFAAIADQIREDPYLHPHLRYYVREVRVVAYSQACPHCSPPCQAALLA